MTYLLVWQQRAETTAGADLNPAPKVVVAEHDVPRTATPEPTQVEREVPSGPQTVAAMPDEMASHHAMGHHDHMASAGQDAAQADTSNDVQSNADSHACLKCCAACMMGNTASVNPEWTVARAMSRVLFPSPDEQLRGHIVFIDPDIPKPVA